jgi:uncharacterized membrane protein
MRPASPQLDAAIFIIAGEREGTTGAGMIFRKRNHTMVRLAIILSLSSALTWLPACSSQPSYPPPLRQGADIVVEIAVLKAEEPKFYTYQYQGKKINFFVCKVRDKVLSFLDACASCYTHKRGYRSDEGTVTCQDCNMKFSVHQLEKGLGGCYPIKIEGRVEGGKYLIPVSTLESASDKF